MGLHFPQEQLTRITPILARLLSSECRFRGCGRDAYLQARNLAKTIARDKPVSTFECTRKHSEHGYNIIRDNHTSKHFYDDKPAMNLMKICDARVQRKHGHAIRR